MKIFVSKLLVNTFYFALGALYLVSIAGYSTFAGPDGQYSNITANEQYRVINNEPAPPISSVSIQTAEIPIGSQALNAQPQIVIDYDSLLYTLVIWLTILTPIIGAVLVIRNKQKSSQPNLPYINKYITSA